MNTHPLGANPLYRPVKGAPYVPGDIARVSGCCDEVGEDVGVPALVGRLCLVRYLEYRCGSGQHYPDDPMIGVQFSTGETQELWKDELELVLRHNIVDRPKEVR